MSQITTLIKGHNLEEIFKFVESLEDNERANLQKELAEIDYQNLDSNDGFELEGKEREVFFNNRQDNVAALEYAMLVSVRNFDELKENFSNEMWRLIFGSARKSESTRKQKIHFFKKYPPNYIDKLIKETNTTSVEFKLLWEFYENGWVKFNEEFFVNSLFYVEMFSRDTEKDAEFLIQNPEAIEKVLLQFYKYEIDILDISKWESREGFQCTKIHKFWTEVFSILMEKEIAIPRALITNLLESLLNHWKKPHLNWHVQLIKLLKPTTNEYIANQNLLFSTLSSDNNTIVNYAVSAIKSIHKLKEFDFETYVESVQALFVNEKVNKSILASLKIMDFGAQNDETLKELIAEQLCLGLVSPNSEIQYEFASRIVKFSAADKLEELVAPYASYLKSKSKEVLGVGKNVEANAVELVANEIEISEIPYPKNWEELLQHISETLRTRNAADMDVLIESIVQLKDQLPPNYQKQLSSYKKQTSREWWDSLMRDFSNFFQNWVKNSDAYQTQTYNSNPTRLPYLSNKFIQAFNKLKANDKLPFLATPTHTPCYVHPEALVDRLLAYEKANAKVDWMDLTIACNRILKDVSCSSFADKANGLAGNYAKAVNYLIGNSTVIELTIDGKTVTDDVLNLWAQIARTKNVDGIYNEFKGTALEGLQSVVRPLDLDFEIVKTTSDSYTWYSLDLDQKWNSMGSKYADLNNYAYSNPFHLTEESHDILYQASMVVNYIDPLLCSHVFFYCNTEGIHSTPLKFILDNNIKVHHSGWIYIAACLLTNEKEVRRMAEEYIVFALANKFMKQEYLADIIAKFIVQMFIPVKRLTDYIERSHTIKELSELHFEILSKCVEKVDLNDKPRSFPKIVTLFKELQKDLGTQPNDELMAKVKSLKK